MPFFSQLEAARRYERFRPKVHRVALGWLTQAAPGHRFARALDVACGTGDSTAPLREIADRVLGLDVSEPMLSFARAKGLEVACAPYDALPAGPFDLITACMAFHWFDRVKALQSFRRASSDGAWWLIYNFAFAGHETDAGFNRWLGEYGGQFPTPPRGATEFYAASEEPDLSLVASGEGWLPLEFDRAALIGYLTTQSNVEAAVQAGRSYEEIEHWMEETMPGIPTTGFRYRYRYSIHACRKPDQPR